MATLQDMLMTVTTEAIAIAGELFVSTEGTICSRLQAMIEHINDGSDAKLSERDRRRLVDLRDFALRRLGNVGPDTLNVAEVSYTHRDFLDVRGFIAALSRLPTVWSWGASRFTIVTPNVLRFGVNGHHHRGLVFVSPNASDLLDLWLTNYRLRVLRTFADVCVDDFVAVVDDAVERIPAYRD